MTSPYLQREAKKLQIYKVDSIEGDDDHAHVYGKEWFARQYDFPYLEEEKVKDNNYWAWACAAVVFLGLALVTLGFSVGP